MAMITVVIVAIFRYQDLYVSLDLDNLNDIKLKTFDKFPNLLYNSCKVKIFEWYTGCDIPVDF